MSNNNATSSGGGGCAIGGIIAAILSWQTFHSLGWAVIAFLFNWLYVIYWMLKYWQ
jgi:hypothetical protein